MDIWHKIKAKWTKKDSQYFLKEFKTYFGPCYVLYYFTAGFGQKKYYHWDHNQWWTIVDCDVFCYDKEEAIEKYEELTGIAPSCKQGGYYDREVI